jgi:hypothetical protein
VPTLFFVKTAVDYYYPGKIKRLAMKTGWRAMEICSKIEIYATNLYTTYMPNVYPYKTQARIKLIDNGVEIVSYSKTDFFKERKNKTLTQKYDFILYEIPIEKKDKYDKYDKYDNYIFRYETINDVIQLEYNSVKSFELNMIQLTMTDSDISYSIELGRNQYMINGNILFDRPFLKWYLRKYCNVSLGEADQYVITFIDHNMNYITLPDYCYLFIKKNNYDIINYIKK